MGAVDDVEEGQTRRNDYRISHHHGAAVLFLASVQWAGGKPNPCFLDGAVRMCCNAGRVFSLGNLDGGPAWQRDDGASWERLKLAIVISGGISKSQRRHIDRVLSLVQFIAFILGRVGPVGPADRGVNTFWRETW